MAEKTATLVIRLKDMASSGLKGFNATVGGMKSAFFATTAAVAGFVAVGLSAIKSYAEQESAISKLENALRNQGVEVGVVSAQYQALASELQRVTTFEDEAILETQALLTTFGVTTDQMEKTTIAALNLSTGLGIDLKSATMLLGKAAQGETASLGRFGLKISESIPVTEKFASVLELVNQRFGGSAQAAAETIAGRIEVLKNRFGELKETLGASLLPVFEMTMSVMEFFAGKLEVIATAINQTGSAWATFQMAMLEGSKFLLETFIATFEPIFLILEKLGFDMDAVTLRINAAIDRQIAKVHQQTAAHKIATTTRVTQERDAVTSQATFMDEERAKEIKKQDEYYAKIKERVDKHFKDEADARIRDVELQELVNQRRVQNMEATLSFISSLATAKNKTLAAVGKSAAIAVATMDTYAAANKALASAPPPWNFGLAAAVTAAGIANVARISGIQLAEGGIVMPRPGGVQATIGEAGQAEAVIPLDDDRAQGMLGGGKTEIHIHAGTIVADRTSVREFAKLLDKELYSLERNHLSVRT